MQNIVMILLCFTLFMWIVYFIVFKIFIQNKLSYVKGKNNQYHPEFPKLQIDGIWYCMPLLFIMIVDGFIFGVVQMLDNNQFKQIVVPITAEIMNIDSFEDDYGNTKHQVNISFKI